MSIDDIEFAETRNLSLEALIPLYRSVAWSSAEKPELLRLALLGSHAVVTAWHEGKLVGLGNAISDGHLVVYFPHLLVHPEYQRLGIGTRLMSLLARRYEGFHQQVLLADGRAVEFYAKRGFERAGRTEPMWIYAGHDHS